MRIGSVLKHSTQAVLEGALIASLVVGLMAGTALAGKPGGGGATAGTLSVVMVSDQNANHAPNWNDVMTFDVKTTATDKPWVKLDCYQAGSWVSTSTAGYFAAYPWDPNFTLASGGWTSGAGDCSAMLYKVASNGRTRTLATMSFHVDP